MWGQKQGVGKKKNGQSKIWKPTDIQHACDHTHCSLQDSHQSCHHSRPPRHTSRQGVYTKCCYTGTHPQDSDAQLRKTERIFTTAEVCVKPDTHFDVITTRAMNNNKKENTVVQSAHTYQLCHNSPHRCHPCSQGRHHTASGWEYSGRSYTGTGRCHISNHSHAEEIPRAQGSAFPSIPSNIYIQFEQD